MANSELKKAIESAVTLSNYINAGAKDETQMASFLKQYANTMDIQFTEEEMQEVIEYAMALSKTNVTTYDELKERRF